MILTSLDWSIILAYLIVSVVVGVLLARRAGQSTGDFFLSGRKLPWYIAGTSMVATTFAADTPLAVTELVGQNGIAGNWLWWNMLFGGMLTVFFFAKLWRRAGILTDAEFVDIRYSGKAARFLRGFRALYVGLFMNMIVIAWVNLAMVKVLSVMFPDLTFFGRSEIRLAGMAFSSHLIYVGLLMLIVAGYSSLSGLWGVALTDFFQFFIAMGGSILLAVVAVRHVGGISGLQQGLAGARWVFDFIPDFGSAEPAAGAGVLKLTLTAVIAYLGVQWWASWYPGAEPGGGGYVAQRMMSAKDERHSLLATLWFQVAHYALRPWPWILVALATLVMYPNEPDRGATYVMVIRDLLPAGAVGLLMAAFLAAYMSTISTQTVWGTSYIVNDLFRPFVKPGAGEKYYVSVSRWTNVLLVILSIVATTQFDRISDAWKFILACSGGIGLVLILRWFWWRINAWSEISAMLAPYAVYPFLKFRYHADFETTLIVIVIWSTLVWLVVTALTAPTSDEKLLSFYKRVHPGGPGWQRVATRLPGVQSDSGYPTLFLSWVLGCATVLLSLFGFGKFLFHQYSAAAFMLTVAAICAVAIYRILVRMEFSG